MFTTYNKKMEKIKMKKGKNNTEMNENFSPK